jgi:PKD repeat protein
VHPSPVSPGIRPRRFERLLLFIPLLASAACALKDGGRGDGDSVVASLRKRNNRPGPTLQTSTTLINLGDRSQSEATFDVWNMGSGSLDYTITADAGNGPAGWLTATPTSGTSTGEHDTIDVSISRSLLAPGAFAGIVHCDAGTQRIDVRIGAQIVAVQTGSSDVSFGYASDPIALDVWNSGAGVLSFNVTSKPAWLQLDRTTGTSSGTLDHQTLHLTCDRSGLTAGHYAGTLEIDPDADQGSHSAQVNVSMDVGAQGGVLAVTPTDNYQGSGFIGGPFSPAGIDYVLSNSGDADLAWSASSSQTWMTFSLFSGTLAPGAATTVTASVDPNVAAQLPAGLFHADLAFTNVTNDKGDAARGADLTVNDPGLKAVIYLTPNPMTIAPYTTLLSGLDSTSTSSTIVRWNWDFGDGGDGNPQTDEEMLAVHRYDNPGTYTVTLTVTDANGSTNTATTTLTVTAFSGRTFYVSSSAGSDSNDGSSSRPFKTLDYAFSKMASNQQNNPDKLLLACGDKWTSSGDLGPPKPSILDCYGSGAQPVIEFSNANNGIGWYGGSGGTPDTWGYSPIVQNLHIRYAGGKNGSDTLVNPFIRGSTFRNCTVENGGIIGSLQREGLVIEGCNVSWGMKLCVYSSGSSVVLRNSTFTGAGSDNIFDHQIYLNNGSRWLLQDCVFDGANTGLNNNAAKLNGGIGVVVRRCEARGSRNGFDAGRNLDETGSGPADNYLYDECISHDNGFGGQAAGLIVSWIRHLTVRNCVFYNHHPTGGGCGAIWLWASNDTDNNVNLYNNVFYSNTIPDIYFSSTQYNLVMRNNVFMRDASGNTGSWIKMNDPKGMLPLVDSDHDVYYWVGKGSSDPGFGMNGDANTSFDTWRNSDGKDANAVYGNPLFTDPSHLDFTLQTGSPAIDVGQCVPMCSRDKNWVPRPKGNADDAGVFER